MIIHNEQVKFILERNIGFISILSLEFAILIDSKIKNYIVFYAKNTTFDKKQDPLMIKSLSKLEINEIFAA